MRVLLSLALSSVLAVVPVHAETRWRVYPSLKFDALCLVGVLSGDLAYAEEYKDERTELGRRMSPVVADAFRLAQQAYRDDRSAAGPGLSLIYSVVDAETLDEMIAVTERPDGMKAAFAASDFWSVARWERFERARPHLLVALNWYKEIGFSAWWADNGGNAALEATNRLQTRLASIDVLPTIERAMGREVPGAQVSVIATRYCRPHVTRVPGARFLTDISQGGERTLQIVGGTAVHEVMHPPHRSDDTRPLAFTETMRMDPFVHGRWLERDPSVGYPTFESYVEENVVKALDQVVGERFGIAYFPDRELRWRDSDGGIHVLAPALYALFVSENFLDGKEDVATFLDRMTKEGRLAPGGIEEILRHAK